MAELLKTKSLGYSDVVLIAQPSTVNSRSEVEIEGWRIVVSAMSSIVGPSFIEACFNLTPDMRPTIHIPRDLFWKENLTKVLELGYPKDRIFVGVGLNTPDIEEFARVNGFSQVLLDVANGLQPQVIKKARELAEGGFIVCTGSVHSKLGASKLIVEGHVQVVRGGIGPGSVCITADSTGFTRGQITELLEMGPVCEEFSVDLMADGGIKGSGDFVKAFLAGADYVMAGGIFKECIEARLHRPESERTLFGAEKVEVLPEGGYFGMASTWGKICMGNNSPHTEGRLITVSSSTTVKDKFEEIWNNIRSGVSYSGFPSLSLAIGRGVFESIK